MKRIHRSALCLVESRSMADCWYIVFGVTSRECLVPYWYSASLSHLGQRTLVTTPLRSCSSCGLLFCEFWRGFFKKNSLISRASVVC